eukprot:149697-Rhodomonas_salina.1
MMRKSGRGTRRSAKERSLVFRPSREQESRRRKRRWPFGWQKQVLLCWSWVLRSRVGKLEYGEAGGSQDALCASYSLLS